ncbi:MAG: carboxypeptidase-like regulatory domain-containing protein [bacterium]
MKSTLIFRAIFGIALLTIVLSIALAQSNGSSIRGVVKSPSGRLYSSVWVIISQDGNEKGRSLTGDDGKYYISNLGDGVYEVRVYEGDRQLYKGQVNLPAESRHDILLR